MSTTYRKARKRAHHRMLKHAGTQVGDALLKMTSFYRVEKTGTPVPDRQENQPFVHLHGATRKPVNTVSAKAKRRLREYDERTAASTRGLPWPDHRRAARTA